MDLCSSAIWFASEYAGQLQQDRVLDETRSAIRTCLSEWSRSFEVQHFDLEACREKGWTLDYSDYVRRAAAAGQTLEGLVRFETHVDLAEELVHSLARSGGDWTKAAWFG